jgi:predicted esterase
VSRPAERLAKLNEAVASLPQTSIEKTTAANLASVLSSMHKGELQSQNFNADALLTEAESAVAARAANKDYYTPARPGFYWLMVPTENGVVPSRVFIPESVQKAKAVPLVFALHGMGGNEHLFFDNYHQKIVKLCQDRGWMLVSPTGKGSAPPLPALIDELARRYPVDRSRVFVLGHSLGAGHAVSLVGAAPQRYAAIAPLGGGGSVKPSEGLKKVAFFVGVGTLDFLITGARSMHKNLKGAGVENAVLREYKDIEHIMVVQVAAADVFAFFDDVAKKPRE